MRCLSGTLHRMTAVRALLKSLAFSPARRKPLAHLPGQRFAGLPLLIELLLQRLLEAALSIEVTAELARFLLCCRRSLLPGGLFPGQLRGELVDPGRELRFKQTHTPRLLLDLVPLLAGSRLQRLQAIPNLRELLIRLCMQTGNRSRQIFMGLPALLHSTHYALLQARDVLPQVLYCLRALLACLLYLSNQTSHFLMKRVLALGNQVVQRLLGELPSLVLRFDALIEERVQLQHVPKLLTNRLINTVQVLHQRVLDLLDTLLVLLVAVDQRLVLLLVIAPGPARLFGELLLVAR